MAEKMDDGQVVSQGELLMSQMIQLDAVTQLLIEMGIFTEQEFFAKLKEVQAQYQSRKASKSQ
jgi:methionyl-tRNA formyltransferase